MHDLNKIEIQITKMYFITNVANNLIKILKLSTYILSFTFFLNLIIGFVFYYILMNK